MELVAHLLFAQRGSHTENALDTCIAFFFCFASSTARALIYAVAMYL